MASFQVFVHDDRCQAPRLRLTLVTDEVHLMGIAKRVLAESDHYTGVEVASIRSAPCFPSVSIG